jgi:hypothetical protein
MASHCLRSNDVTLIPRQLSDVRISAAYMPVAEMNAVSRFRCRNVSYQTHGGLVSSAYGSATGTPRRAGAEPRARGADELPPADFRSGLQRKSARAQERVGRRTRWRRRRADRVVSATETILPGPAAVFSPRGDRALPVSPQAMRTAVSNTSQLACRRFSGRSRETKAETVTPAAARAPGGLLLSRRRLASSSFDLSSQRLY